MPRTTIIAMGVSLLAAFGAAPLCFAEDLAAGEQKAGEPRKDILTKEDAAKILARLQGTWVSLERPYTIEFRQQTAIFRGMNPFLPPDRLVDQSVQEFSLRFTLDAEAAPTRINFSSGDYGKFIAAQKKKRHDVRRYAELPHGFYRREFFPIDLTLPEIHLGFHHGERWTKEAMKLSPAPLAFPEHKFLQLTKAEVDAYARLQGVWTGELIYDGKTMRSSAWVILPGWVLEHSGKYGQLQVKLDPVRREFALRKVIEIPLEERVFELGKAVADREIQSYRGDYQIEGDFLSASVRRNIEWDEPWLSFPLTVLPDYEKIIADMKLDLNAAKSADRDNPEKKLLEIRERHLRAAFKKLVAKVDKEGDAAKKNEFDKYRAWIEHGAEFEMKLTRVKVAADEDLIFAWHKARHPERLTIEKLAGTWERTTQTKLADVALKPNATEGKIVAGEPQTWTITPGKLEIALDSGKRTELLLDFHYEHGMATVRAADKTSIAGIVRIRLDKNDLTIEIHCDSSWPIAADVGSWQHTFRRIPPPAEKK